MITLDIVQGEQNWHEARAKYSRTASRASAMMGCSKYATRQQLLCEIATGITQDVDAATQRRFDEGHRIEERARPMAEKIIGKKLYPVTAISDDEYMLVSYDGLSADDEDAWECKSWNEKKAEDVRAGVVPKEDLWQVIQQLAIGANRCMYMVTDGTEERMEYCWMLREDVEEEVVRLIAGWNQADIDLENYQHVEHAEKPEATPVIGLPALFAQVEGKFNLATNIDLFSSELKQFVGKMDLSPIDDQGFADLEAQVKVCTQAEESIKAQVLGARGQMVTFDEFCKTAELLLAIASRARIDGTNAIKDKKVAIKAKAIADARALFAAHVAGLEVEIAPIRLIVEQPDFIAATKGLKGLKSLHNEIDTALANGKIAADAIAKDIRAKLAWCKENAAGMSFLFPDLQQIITKPLDDFTLLITSRIKDHKDAEAKKLEEQTARIRAEEEAKAKAKVEEEQRQAAEAQAKIDREAAEKLKAEQDAIDAAAQREHEKALAGEPYVLQPAEAAKNNPPQSQVAKPASEVVIERQAEISAFLASRDFGKEEGKVRAILVEFVKFSAQFNSKKAA